MKSLRSGLAGLALALSGLALASPARADLPPPDGQKFVGFAFQIEGAAALTDHVLVAYPCTGSNGVPVDGYARIGAEPIEVGRRGGWCTLYAVKKPAFEAFEKGRKPSEAVGRDPALEAFFKSADAKECDVKLSMQSVLPKSDPREQVLEKLRVARVADGVCDLEPVAGGAAPSSPPVATAAASASAAAAPSASGGAPAATAPSSSAGPNGPSGGCAGCAVVDEEDEGSWIGGAVTALAIVGGFAARRRRGDRA